MCLLILCPIFELRLSLIFDKHSTATRQREVVLTIKQLYTVWLARTSLKSMFAAIVSTRKKMLSDLAQGSYFPQTDYKFTSNTTIMKDHNTKSYLRHRSSVNLSSLARTFLLHRRVGVCRQRRSRTIWQRANSRSVILLVGRLLFVIPPNNVQDQQSN